MTVDYKRRIERAEELAVSMPEAAELLTFYAGLAPLQQSLFDRTSTDVNVVAEFVDPLLDLLRRSAPEPLRSFTVAREDLQRMFLAYWGGDRSESPDTQFFLRALAQPYWERMVAGSTPVSQTTTATCPFCHSKPVVAVLRGEGEGAKRSLVCSLCSTEWPFRRVACPGCGEGDKDKLPVLIAEELAHVRIEACDTCRVYIKSVDLTRNGHAEPIVDEIASVALDLRAAEDGYSKLECNLLGI